MLVQGKEDFCKVIHEAAGSLATDALPQSKQHGKRTLPLSLLPPMSLAPQGCCSGIEPRAAWGAHGPVSLTSSTACSSALPFSCTTCPTGAISPQRGSNSVCNTEARLSQCQHKLLCPTSASLLPSQLSQRTPRWHDTHKKATGCFDCWGLGKLE